MSVCLSIITLCMLGALVLPPSAHDCEFNLKVRRETHVTSIGQKLKLACPVHLCDDDPPTITWFKLDTERTLVNLSDRVTTEWKIINEHEGIFFLNFQYVISRDSGLYHFCGINVPYHYDSVAGDQLKIACPVCDNLMQTMTWYKNDTQGFMSVNMSDRVTTKWIRINDYKAMSYLIFHKVLSSDSGRYLCNGTFVNHTIDVYVIVCFIYVSWKYVCVLSIFTLAMFGALTMPLYVHACESRLNIRGNLAYEAYVGRELKMSCPVQMCNSSTPTVTWLRLERDQFTPVNLTDRVTTEWNKTNDHEGVLSLNFHHVSVKIQDCISVRLDQTGAPSSTFCRSEVHHNSVYNGTAEEPLRVSCSVCDDLPTVIWFKYVREGLIPVNMSERLTTEWTRLNDYKATSYLIFHKVLSSDSGRYLCSGTSVNTTIHVHVTDTDVSKALKDSNSNFNVQDQENVL
ncbi:hypothetical protein WMY93_022456 [Mugilogobius chulae]|uniref:Ig-like domain-containing protein n=1 Tax=Mugilogobius chulae TaxID=88201 RepID=A0AAW0NCU0_9GOBI